MRFLTLTLDPAIDRILFANELLPGQSIDTELRCCIPSGDGVNTARMLRALVDEPVAAGVWVGVEDEAWFIEKATQISDVQLLVCPRRGFARRTSTVIEHSGRETIINEAVKPPDSIEQGNLLEFWRKTVKPGDIVAVCGTTPHEAANAIIHALFRIAREQHAAAIISDINVAPEIVASSGLDGVKGSVAEISAWLGLSAPLDLEIIGHRETVKEALSRNGAPAAILVMLGKGGAVLITSSEMFRAKLPHFHASSEEPAAICDDAATAGWLWSLRDQCGPSETLRRVLACWTAKSFNSDPDPGRLESHSVTLMLPKIEVAPITDV